MSSRKIAVITFERKLTINKNWRVNVTKFLLTVFVFGLFSSFAFAEEKTPEQLREERSGIEGLETQTLTRVVFAKAPNRLLL